MKNTKTNPCLPAAPRRGKSSILHSAYCTMRHSASRILHSAFLVVALAAMTAGTSFAQDPYELSKITSAGGALSYGVGDQIHFTVALIADVDSVTGGSPYLVLSGIQNASGAEARATYDGSIAGGKLPFTYTVRPGDFSTGVGIASFNSNGATISADEGEGLDVLPQNPALPTPTETKVLAGETITIRTITFADGSTTKAAGQLEAGGTLDVEITRGGNPSLDQGFTITVAPAAQSGNISVPTFKIPSGSTSATCQIGLTAASEAITVTFHPTGYTGADGDLILTLTVIQGEAPHAVKVYNDGEDRTYSVGDTIDIAVELSDVITDVEGSPYLILDILNQDTTQKRAIYTDEYAGKFMYFQYTVQPGDFAKDLDLKSPGFNLNGATVTCGTKTLDRHGARAIPVGANTEGSLSQNANINITTITLDDFSLARSLTGSEGETLHVEITRREQSSKVQRFSITPSIPNKVDVPVDFSIAREQESAMLDIDLVEATGSDTLTLTIHPSGYNSNGSDVTDGDIVLSITITAGTKPPIVITGPSQMEEGAVSQELTVSLSRPPRETTIVKVSSDFPANLAILSATSLTFAPGDTTTRSVTVKPLDGDKQVTITAEQQGATLSYSPVNYPVFVVNKNPEIVSPPAENWEPPKGGEGFAYNVSWSAKDVAADQPGLDAIIYWGDGNSTTVADTPQGSTTHVYNVPGSFGITIEIRDKDGGVATVSGTVEIEPAVTIVINEYKTYPYPGDVGQNSYKGLGGLGRGTVDDNVDETSRIPLTENIDWQIKYSPSTATATLIASPETFTYEGVDYEGNAGDYEYDSFFHVWLGDEETFRSQWCLIPLSAPVTAAIRLRDGGDSADRQVGAVFSREHYSEDNYADIDWDRLPDRWESLYLSALVSGGNDGGEEKTYPFETPAGIFGENGNPDKDFLPACVTGIDAVTGEFTIEGCDFSPTGLAFINLYEIRGTHAGLNARNSDPVDPQDEPHIGSYDTDAEITDDGIFTDNDTREFFGTDPTKPDTDEDKLTDGYEYFFWRMAKFGDAKGQAYSPTKVVEGDPIDNALIEAYFNPCVPNDHLTLDVDGDGLTDFEEFLLGTNPIHWDTDGDGMNDGWEVMWGLNPKDKEDATENPDGDFMANDGQGRFHWEVYSHYGFDPRTAWNATYLERNRVLAEDSPNTAPFSNYNEHYLARWCIDHGFINEVEPMSGFFMTQPVPYGTPRFYNPAWKGTKRKVPNYSVTPSEGGAADAADGDPAAATASTGGYTVPFGDLSFIVEQIPITTHGCDSDGDGMPDGWELYLCSTDGTMLNGLWPIGEGAAADRRMDAEPPFDGDNLVNVEECRSVELCDYYSSICTNGSFTFSGNWFNKWWPTDPFNPDTDGDHIPDGYEGDDTFRYQEAFTTGGTNGAATAEAFVAARFGNTTMLRGHVPGGGLNPCCIDTDMDYIPDHWEYLYAGHYRDTAWAGGFCNEPGTETGLAVQNGQAFIVLNGAGMDGTYFDSRSGYDEHTGAENRNFDFDGDGLENYQEYWINGVRHFQYDKWVAGGDYGDYDIQEIFATGLFPKAKDLGYKFKKKWLDGKTPLTEPIHPLFMSWDWSTYANDWQNAGGENPGSDPHVMTAPSMFHYMPSEIRPRPMGAYLYASTDPRLADSDGDGMDDYYEMFHGLNPILSDVIDYCMQQHPAGETYDFRAFPWMAGMPNADPDGDDIPNWEEALSPGQPAPANHNTDPSPMWMTDMSYDRSFVNLYYDWGSAANFWTTENDQYPEYKYYPFPDNMVPGMVDPRAHYVFDFECNEGFDTDNDNLSDPYEINGAAGGVTDAQNPDRPIGRKALYLDGNAAARTRSLCAFGPNALRSFTLEVWVMPEEPATGRMQVVLERPVTWDESNTAPTYENIRRNFRLGLLGDGRPFVEFDNGGKNLITERAIAPEGSALEAGRWYHLAATMDGFSGKLALYKDGRRIASKSTTSIPYTGFTTTALNAVGSDEYHQPRWSPVVIGASDANPVGQVDGSYEYYNGAIGDIQGGQPQLGDFFKGWVDEVRIWDGARPGGEDAGDQRVAFWRWPTIKDDYDNLKRYGMDEVLATRNDVVKYLNRILDWRKRSIDTANAGATAGVNGSNPVNPSDTNTVVSADTTWSLDGRGLTFDEFIQQAVTYILMTGGEDIKCRIPPSLVCVYNFDTLPDPDYEPTQPAKFASLNGRPMDYNGVPWWRGATDRSTVYTSVEAPYLFPQYIQNLVSWQPLGHLAAAGTDAEYNEILHDNGVISANVDANMPLFAYQPDSVVNSKYWTRYTKGGQNLADLEAYSTWGTDMENSFPNSANPYGYRYETGIIVNEENHPITMMQEAYDPSYAALFNDLVPLRNARADMSVQLWDDPTGNKIGVNADTDHDGLPDYWEIANGMDPYNADQNGNGVQDAYDDFDGDTLSNYFEMLSGTNPNDATTNGVDPDPDADSDGDGLSNLEEIAIFSHPYRYDTDDDGLSDGEEVARGTNPCDSLDPFTQNYLHNDGKGWLTIPSCIAQKRIDGTLMDPYGERFDLEHWTIDMAVRPKSFANDVILISRATHPYGYINYELGIAAGGIPYVRFETPSGVEYRINGVNPLPLNTWTFIGGRFGEAPEGGNELALFVNGDQYARNVNLAACATGHAYDPLTGSAEPGTVGDIIIANGLNGDIDELRVWNKAIPKDLYLKDIFDETILIGKDIINCGSLDCDTTSVKTLLYDDELSEVPDLTVEAWFKTTESGTIIRRATQSGSSVSYDVTIGADGKLTAMVSGWYVNALGDVIFVPMTLTSLNQVNDGAWHHFAITATGGTKIMASLFIDGVINGRDNYLLDVNAETGETIYDETLGMWYVRAVRYLTQGETVEIGNAFSGQIDEVRVWGVARSENEIINSRCSVLHLTTEIYDGLLYYFDFDDVDDTVSPVRIDNRADATRSGIIVANLGTPISEESAPIAFDPLTTLFSKLALYLPFDDGRGDDGIIGEVEDFAHRIMGLSDIRNAYNEAYCGHLSDTAHIDFALYNPKTDPAPFRNYYAMDTDGDHLPDYWEREWRFDPYFSDQDGNLRDDYLDDFDNDGLSNDAEMRAGLDPFNPDSDGDGVFDFNDVPDSLASTPLSYGWLFTDSDYVLDAYEEGWEDAYASRFRYDEHEDRDIDGWDNWSEGLAGTVLAYNAYNAPVIAEDGNDGNVGVNFQEASAEDKAVNFPLPNLTVTLDYGGQAITGAKLVIHAYSHEDMNGWPDAVFVKDFSADTLDTWPMTVTMGPDDIAYGHIRQGKNWFFAWLDGEGSAGSAGNDAGQGADAASSTGSWPTWNAPEPAAIADNQLDGIDIGFDLNEVTFHLTDKAESFARISWEGAMPVGQDVHVAMLYSGNAVFDRVIKWPRTWLHEGDIISWNIEQSGLTGSDRKNFGLGALEATVSANDEVVRGFEVVLTPQGDFEGDQWAIEVSGVISNWMHSASALSKPVLYGPIGQEIVSEARPEFKFSLDPEFSEFRFRILKRRAETDDWTNPITMVDERVVAPGRFWNDATHRRDLVIFDSPLCVGDVTENIVVFDPGKQYQWVVTAYSPAIRSGVSSVVGYFQTPDATATSAVNAPSGKGSIKVNVTYPSGLAYKGSTSPFIRVQAFRSKSFNGPPDASVRIANPATCIIRGLEDGQSYYVRAYIEQNGDRERAKWESWGYYRAGNGMDNPFVPVSITATSLGNSSPYQITIQDCDTDNDLLPDSYEWAKKGNLTSLGVANYASSVRKTVAYGVSPLALAAADPVAFVDADGDGISDYDEISNGSDPALADSDGDGIADGLERTLGSAFDNTTQQTLKITSVSFDANGNPVIDWTWDGAASPAKGRAALKMGREVVYEVQAKVALTDPEWTTIRTVYTDDIDGEAVITEEGAPAGVDVSAFRFFRVKLGTE